MWECVTSTLEHIDQADGSSCGNSEKIRNSACGTISAHCLICAISCLVHSPHICVLMRYLYRTNHQNLSPHLKQWPLNLKLVNRWNQFHALTVPTTVNGLIVVPPVFGPFVKTYYCLWQAVGDDLMFEVEVIDPKDNQRDIEQEER